MSRDISDVRLKSCNTLFQMGLSALRERGCDTEKERNKLMAACDEAEQLFELEREYSLLFQQALKRPTSPLGWNSLIRINKKLYGLVMTHVRNCHYYGWTPLARSIIREKAMQKACTPRRIDYDLLETILAENEAQMMVDSSEVDCMEDFLSEYENNRE